MNLYRLEIIMQSKFRATLLIGTLAAMCSAADANPATYRLALKGVADHWAYCFWEGLDCTGILPVYSDWSGVLTINIDSSADGIFETPDINSMSLDANAGSFSYPISEFGYGVTASVVNGRVASIDAPYLPVPLPDGNVAEMWFGGLRVSFGDTGTHHYGPTTYLGTLTSVPEPDGLSLMACALAMAAAWRFASRLSPAPGRQPR